MLRALLLSRLGRQEQALEVMRDALLQGQELGLVRSLLDLGEPALLLAEACAQAFGASDPLLAFYVERLQQQSQRYRSVQQPEEAGLSEPLSERELEILRALAHSMSNKRIAQVLGISPETVKWHLRNVYGKLKVVGRDDAVARARDLGLVQG